jgi:hypothetical protein
MNRDEIIQFRLFNQGLSDNYFDNPEEIVAHFGAMQAQDYSMSLWAIGLRMQNPEKSAIEKLTNAGKIIRTHILRPTWHLVHQKDIRWMMQLSAPNVKKATQYIDKKQGLTDELFLKAWKIIEQEFTRNEFLNKEKIVSCLSNQQMVISNLLATQIIMRAEVEMLLCNGNQKNVYALFENRIPTANVISKQEAIVKLAQLYFKSRGPATLKDFVWWSGLSLNDAKIGVAELDKQLQSFTYDKLKYYHFEIKNNIPKRPSFALLPCYDEYTVGYSEGRNIVLPAGVDSAETGNGIFKPTILSENELVGTWRKGKKNRVEIQSFTDDKNSVEKAIKEDIEKFCKFII